MIRIIANIALTVYIIGVYVYSIYRLKKNWHVNHPRMNCFFVILDIICLILGVWILYDNWLRV